MKTNIYDDLFSDTIQYSEKELRQIILGLCEYITSDNDLKTLVQIYELEYGQKYPSVVSSIKKDIRWYISRHSLLPIEEQENLKKQFKLENKARSSLCG